MPKQTVSLTVDAAIVSRAEQRGAFSAVTEAALTAYLAEDRRWAEENALLVEALAGGAAEAAE